MSVFSHGLSWPLWKSLISQRGLEPKIENFCSPHSLPISALFPQGFLLTQRRALWLHAQWRLLKVLNGAVSQGSLLTWTPLPGESINQAAVLIVCLFSQGSSLGWVPRTIIHYIFIRGLSGRGRLWVHSLILFSLREIIRTRFHSVLISVHTSSMIVRDLFKVTQTVRMK